MLQQKVYTSQDVQEATVWKLGDNEDLISISDSRPLPPAPLTLQHSNTHQRRASLDGDNKEKKVETIKNNTRWR